MEPGNKKSELVPADWLDEYGDYLYSYAISRVNSRDHAQDIVQETLLAAFRTHENFSGKSSVKTWLTTILRSKIVDYFRTKGAKIVVSYEDFHSPFKSEEPFKGHWTDSKTPQGWDVDAIAKIESKEFVTVLEQCMDALPENWRSVVSLKLLEDHKTDFICKELNISPSNLWVIIHRAKLKLRDCLEINWFIEPNRNEEQ